MKMKICSKCKRELPATSEYFHNDKKRKDGLYPQCKECKLNRKMFAKEGFKICNKCQRELPMNTDYFTRSKDTSDGFLTRCKECIGMKFTNKLSKIPKEGYKFCIKCDRELKATPSYFPVDKNCKDGLRNICRECGDDGHFMPEDYIPKKWWTKEDEELLIKLYPHYLNEELIELYFKNKTLKALTDKAYQLSKKHNIKLVKTKETLERKYKIHSERMSGENAPNYGKKLSEETRRKISEARIGKYCGENSPVFGKPKSEEVKRKISISKKKLGLWKGKNNPRYKNPLVGEQNPNWKGGITPIHAKIRNSDKYFNWKIAVFKRDNYTCQRCGSKSKLEAHHIENFAECEAKRFDIDNGISLCTYCHNPIHKGSFHNVYGTKNNNLKQLQEYFIGVSWDLNTRKLYKKEV